ncbi:MAG: hypothetical protein ACOX2R_00720 [Anaerolineae bacterium]
MMAQKRMDADLRSKVRDIVAHADAYHDRYCAANRFGGPSLYFHRRALGLEGQVSGCAQTELVYAVPASWGMHRMGAGGSKMQPFDRFEQSLRPLNGDLAALQQVHPADMTPGEWRCLERIFKGIRVMATNTSLVGNSKVMAHLLPNLVAPIDREYTLKYLFGSNNIQNDLDSEWWLLQKIHSEFFYAVANDAGVRAKAHRWLADQATYPWDTSILKVVDNLLIGAMQ